MWARVAGFGRFACCLVLAAVFLAAGVSKVVDLESFRSRLELQLGLGPGSALALGYFLPWLELVLGWCLVLGHGRREALALVALLLLLFLVQGLFHPAIAGDCGCLLLPPAVSFANHGRWAQVRNVVLLAGALWLFGSGPPTPPRTAPEGPPPRC